MPDDTPNHDLAGKHPALAGAPGGAQAPDTPGGDPARCGPEHGLREGAGAGGEDSRDTRPGNATRYVETTRGLLSYTDLAPLLAERVALVELAAMIAAGCVRLGFPRPREVIVTPVSAHLGAPPAHAFPRLRRKDGSERRHTHSILIFKETVRGPVIIGAGRYRGYGLCRPMEVEQ